MEAENIIFKKLEAFIKKFYTNELLKGLIFFIGLGVLYFIITLLVEYFLWLPSVGRTVLFWVFITVELVLLARFIVFPVFKLFRLQKGIDYDTASRIIGNHFPEINDRLTNFLQLSRHDEKSELLAASIAQKADNLKPIPFVNAVSFKQNRKYLPWASIPLLLLLFFMVSGNSGIITNSLDRVVHYQNRYTPPAPFKFVILNRDLKTEQGEDFVLQLKATGSVIPENAMIYIHNESYFLENIKPGVFQYRFTKPVANIMFHVEANTVSSPDYELKVIAVPTIANFEMQLRYPGYLNKKPEVVKGTGNAIVPEGTAITWKLATQTTKEVEWTDFQHNSPFLHEGNTFTLTKHITQNTEYQILTSNSNVKHHEKLNYQVGVIKDQYPTITINAIPDSIKAGKSLVVGQVSDDYGLSKLQIVFYPIDQPKQIRKANLAIKKETFDQFVFTFPGNLKIDDGVVYEYYFEVFDNDVLHNFKSTKSSVFGHRELTHEENEDKVLQEQNSNINSLEKSLKNQDKQMNELDKLQKMNKEKNSLEFKDQQKIQEFLKRQKQQEEMMKEFSKKLEDNLDKFKTDKKEEQKEALKERLKNADKEIEKNQKLLDELKELTNKINQEELFEKIDKFKQASKDQNKNLEQLVELTKRFYVEKKAEQLADKLNKLAEKEDKLADENKKENAVKEQQDLNKEFDKIKEDLKNLDKENNDLKTPMDIPSDEKEEKSISEDMQKSVEELQKKDSGKAKAKQKSAADKMKKMGGKMMEAMAMEGAEQLEEDVKMLRQILDNLLAFSFSQEDLMGRFKNAKRGAPSYNKNLKLQQDLKLQFRHVDDSLFAMSLRNPAIDEIITSEVGNVHYNLDKSIETLADSQIPKGVSHQQYTITAANKLADFLSEALNQMQSQMQMQGVGKGKPKPGQGQGMQLPDIIKKQGELGEKMKKGMKGEKEGEGKEGKEGKNGEPGNRGKGEKGNKGENGSDGEGEANDVFEIYKEQQRLKEALQKILQKEGMSGSGQNALNKMKEIEKELLNKGFKNETLQKMLNLNHELLKLDNAIQQQGEENKRQSQTNKKDFNNQAVPLSPALQDYLNSIEILNRQSLPLRPNYNKKVQLYFKKND